VTDVIVTKEMALLAGGVLGAFCRAMASATQQTFSRRTFIDVVIGGAMGIITPILKLDHVLPLKDAGAFTLLDHAAVACVVAFIANWATTLIGFRLGIIWPEKKTT
jgi:hypothetical protein